MAWRKMGIQKLADDGTVKLREGERLYQKTSSPTDGGFQHLRDITPGAQNRADVNRAASLAAIAQARANEENAGRMRQTGTLEAWQEQQGMNNPAFEREKSLQQMVMDNAAQNNLLTQALQQSQMGAPLPGNADPLALDNRDVMAQSESVWDRAQKQALRKQALGLAASGFGLPEGVGLQDITEDHIFDMQRRAGEAQRQQQFLQNYNSLAKLFATQAKQTDAAMSAKDLHEMVLDAMGMKSGGGGSGGARGDDMVEQLLSGY